MWPTPTPTRMGFHELTSIRQVPELLERLS